MVDARAGPGFKLTKPKKEKSREAKKKSKLKRLHKFKRQSELQFCKMKGVSVVYVAVIIQFGFTCP